jgi:alpha-L-rhamnosidase
MKRLRFVLLVSAFLCVSSSNAQPDPQSKLWKAQWITSADAPHRDQAILHFRKTIELPQQPTHFIVDVSADNQFILFVNGHRAGVGPSRADLARWRYETYDIAPFLHQGTNVLAATVWNFATFAALAQMTDRIGFLLHGNSDAERIADTDSTWDVEQEKGIDLLPVKLPGFYYAAEPGITLDANKFDWSWNSDSPQKKESWTKAVTLGRGALRGETDAPNNWQLVSDPLPLMEMTLESAGTVARVTGIPKPPNFPAAGFTIPANTTASILLDNGHLTTAYPALTASGGSGATIRLTYAEALYDDNGEKGNRNEIDGKHILGLVDEFLSGGSTSHEFMPLGWRTWRYLQLDVETKDQPLTIEGLRSWFTAYPFVEKASFQSDDPSLTPIWQIGWRTARLDAHDTYMDTPYWERLQYIGDTRLQALISYTVAGDDRLGRQAIEAFNHSRIPDGLTQSRYPSSLVQMIPTFSLLWIGMVHDFYIYRDDPDFVRRNVPGVRTVLDWFLRHQRPDGLLAKIEWWPFVDWGKDFEGGMPPQDENGGSSVLTLQFIEALRYAAELEDAYGDPHVAENYRRAAERASKAIPELCWNQKYGLLADTPAQQHFSQHANILAVWLDILPKEQHKNVLTKILSTSDPDFTVSDSVPPMTSASYYFRFYLARALEHAGVADDYLRLLKPWHDMVSLGLTTWAESPEPTRSDSHAWSAHPNYDLLTLVAGIRPKSSRFETVLIEPHLGALKNVHATLPIPKGLVEVQYARAANGIEAEVTLPAGVSGELVWHGRKTPIHPGKQKLHLP